MIRKIIYFILLVFTGFVGIFGSVADIFQLISLFLNRPTLTGVSKLSDFLILNLAVLLIFYGLLKKRDWVFTFTISLSLTTLSTVLYSLIILQNVKEAFGNLIIILFLMLFAFFCRSYLPKKQGLAKKWIVMGVGIGLLDLILTIIYKH